jgi:hypothetical protein
MREVERGFPGFGFGFGFGSVHGGAWLMGFW